MENKKQPPAITGITGGSPFAVRSKQMRRIFALDYTNKRQPHLVYGLSVMPEGRSA